MAKAKSRDGGQRGWRATITRALAGGLTERIHLIELLREAHTRTLIDTDTFAMLEGALSVADQQVRDIMVPRAQMVCIRRDDPLPRILSAVVEAGHSRYPVVDGDRDDVVGILLAKDLLRATTGKVAGRFDLREYLRPAVFVPEAKRLNVLLQDFRRNRNHMALVVDEYGGVAGLVTIEDVIEQIIGDIDDEFDVEDDQNIRAEADRQYSVRGATPIDEFNEFFKTQLPPGDYETVAGLVMNHLARVPRRGESVVINGFEFRVMRTDRRRVDILRVTPAANPPAAATPPASDGA